MRYTFAPVLGIPVRKHPSSPPAEAPTTASPSGTSYSYTAQVLDGGNHVVSEASNSFLTAKVYDDAATSTQDPWPAGLSFTDYSAWTTYGTTASPDLGIDVLHLYANFARSHGDSSEDATTWHANGVVYGKSDDAHQSIPPGAAGTGAVANAIGMWVNPHGANIWLTSRIQDARTQYFDFLYGVRDLEYNFSHPQDNRFVNWDGWRWVTMPFDQYYFNFVDPGSLVDPNGIEQRPFLWKNPFIIQSYGASTASVDICGLTYLE